VDRLLKSPSKQRGRDFAIMLRTLGDLGYEVEWRVVNSAEYGFPQRRIRVFIVAYKKKAKRNPEQIITKSGILARALPIEKKEYSFKTFELDDDASDISTTFNKGGGMSPFANSGHYSNGVVTTAKTIAKEVLDKTFLGDIIIRDSEVPEEYWVEGKRLREWEYLKGAKSIERTHKTSGVTYNYAEGKMAFPDSLKKPSRTILTGEGGSTPSRFKHIISTKTGFRRLLPIELERLNGFPDDWTKLDREGKTINDARRAFFMGNALVIGVIARVGKVLASEMKEKNAKF
jgi:DNA (cytosine-5)-methyltransferase 1